jgi:hypothetical protein
MAIEVIATSGVCRLSLVGNVPGLLAAEGEVLFTVGMFLSGKGFVQR